jgi:C1A family cysteine protease
MFLSVAAAAAVLILPGVVASSESDSALFAEFKHRFAKSYGSEAEETRRLAAFQQSLERVRTSGSPASGITKFSDLQPDEFAAKYHRPRAPLSATERREIGEWDGTCTACKRFPELAGETPAEFDWTTRGAVTPIKDQGDCGGCYSFATTVRKTPFF